jgi:M6 family metalloprotease-like protein
MTRRRVSIEALPSPLFVGSYAKIPVVISPRSNLTMADLEFAVKPRRAGRTVGGCQVSLSRDGDFDPERPDVMLLAGYKPGDYQLSVVERATGQELANARFAVNAQWPDDLRGPGLWVAGEFELRGIAGAAWGGGSPTDPENLNVAPAIGVRRIAVLLVDTASQRFDPTTFAATRALWEEISLTGRVINGKTVSAAHYYREASYNQLDLQGAVFGPASLSGAWSDYFEDSGEPKGVFWQACVTAGDSLIDYRVVDYLVCVVQSVGATATTGPLSVWPWGNAIMAKTADGDTALAMVAIHADGDPFGLCATLVHELGHDLELGGDVYAWGGHTPQIQAREMDGWDIMAHQGGLPHPCLVHRMRMGWVPKSAVKLYNFQTVSGYVDEAVTLQPIELANPPAGKYSGIEIRIAPGWDYYFEYRASQASQIGDQHLPSDQRVLGTDVMYGDDLEYITRRKPVMLLENDADGDGPVLGSGQDYKDQDTSSGIPTDFRSAVMVADGTKADVQVQYGVSSQPDPSIRRWSPPVYKSPDIEIRNARSDADPKWLNVPWEDHPNTVVASVTNRGTMNAPGVHVDFSVFDYTANTPGVQPAPIGDDTKDIPALATVPFQTTWRPLRGGHYCIEARIRHYQTPGANSVIEATEFNNVAQSNYDQFISKTASPASRETTSVRLHNPYDVELRVYLRSVSSTSPLFRTYLDHTWVRLQPGESRDVRVMFEYAYLEDPVHVPELERYIEKPNDVSISAIGQYRTRPPAEAHVPLGGVSVRVRKGRATGFSELRSDPPVISGRVFVRDTGESVDGGHVILTVTSGGREREMTSGVTPSGDFSFRVDGAWDSLQAYYLPTDRLGDAYSEVLRRQP